MPVRTLLTAVLILTLSAPLARAGEDRKTLCGDRHAIREILIDTREALAELRGMAATHTDHMTRRQMTRKAEQIRRLLDRLRGELAMPEEAAPPPPPVELPRAMSEGRFDSLLKSIDAESFPKGKLAVLVDAAQHHHFTADQVRRAMRRFSFADGKVKAAATMHPRLIDPENFFEVYKELTFDSDKKKLRALIEGK